MYTASLVLFCFGDPRQLFQVGHGLQTHADVLQVGVEGPGEAGSESAAITTEYIRPRGSNRHCLGR